jgi:hypothetical protein
MQQILERVTQPDWYLSIFVSIWCGLVVTAIRLSPRLQTARSVSMLTIITFIGFLAFLLVARTQVAVVDIPKSSDHTPSVAQAQAPVQTKPGASAILPVVPMGNGITPVQFMPECSTSQSPYIPVKQRTAKQLYCSVLPCYGSNTELEQNVLLLGEWFKLTELSLTSCNSSDRKLLSADMVLAKLSQLPEAKIGTYEDRQYCSDLRYALIDKIEATMTRLQLLPPRCTNKFEEASATVTTFMQKIGR